MEYAEYNKQDGVFNTEADATLRTDRVWSDTNPFWYKAGIPEQYARMKCRNCGGLEFEVLLGGRYELLTKCWKCNMYYIAYSG